MFKQDGLLLLGGLAGKGGEKIFKPLGVRASFSGGVRPKTAAPRTRDRSAVQGLAGEYGPRTLGGAFFATGCVKGDHGGVGEAAAYECVELRR